MALAMAAARSLRLSSSSSPIVRRFSTKVLPSPAKAALEQVPNFFGPTKRRFSTKVPLSQAEAALEQLCNLFAASKPDLAKVSKLAEELLQVIKEEEADVVIAKSRGLVSELSKTLNAPTTEMKLSQLESALKTNKKVGVAVSTLFGAYLMSIPSNVFIAKIGADNEIEKLKSRVFELECAGALKTTKLNVEAKLSHEILPQDSGMKPVNTK